MAADRSIAESRAHSTGGFIHLREAISRLKADVERAVAIRDEPAAAEAHRGLIDLEHELRVRETVRRCSARPETAK